MTYIVTLCYTNRDIIRNYFTNIANNLRGKIDVHILVDHLYPKNPMAINHFIMDMCSFWESTYLWPLKVIRPIKNMGGAHGFNWALAQIDLKPEDIVIGIDPDCNITTPGFNQAMVDVLRADESLGSISLYLDAIKHREGQWKIEDIAGKRVGFLDCPEMFNVTAWKGDFLLKGNGLGSLLPYYGHVEVAMHNKAKELGFRQGYLLDYHETFNKVPHDPEYDKWKTAIVHGYKKNFDEYLKENAH